MTIPFFNFSKPLTVTKAYFPQYVAEIEGYARSASVDFLEFWARSLEDEFSYYQEGHCTSVVTNDGKLISHNEDWAKDAADEIYVIQKTVGKRTILELNYFMTLGETQPALIRMGILILSTH